MAELGYLPKTYVRAPETERGMMSTAKSMGAHG